MRPRVPRLTLLQTFSVISLLVIAALGITLGTILHARIEHRALDDTRRLAVTVARTGVAGQLRDGEPDTGPLSSERIAALDHWFASSGLLRGKLYDRSGRVAWSDDPVFIGRIAESNAGVRTALSGRIKAHVEDDAEELGAKGRFFEVYVPIRGGVFESYTPYEPTAAAISRDTRLLIGALTGGLLLLWVTLFRLVARASRRLRHQASHDTLTDLPNRTALHERGASALAAARRHGGLAALLLIDIDRFKEVNDTMGHEQGDQLLIEVADRLRDALRRGDVLARLGGDEFAVLAVLPHRGALGEVATRLHAALVRPFDVGGVAVELGASIGIAVQPDHGHDVSALLRRADVAMYQAKLAGTQIETYHASRDPYSPERLTLLGELRHAIDHDELVLHFQPKVALGSGRVVGVEALVRWQHPERGLLAPGDFLSLAERTGLITDVTHWVLEAAVRQCAQWREEGTDLPVAINLAAANIVDMTLPARVAETLRRWDLPGHCLECEISEDTVMGDPRRATEVLERLRALGVRLSLDDFGTGHSSLSYLKRLPLDEVKIDRSFVSAMAAEASDAAIVRSTIDLARHLGLDVVAEGVETEDVLDMLHALDCDIAQGFLLSRPLPAAELDGWLATRA
ncbi:MAG TPA: EAL domain-containing protein [Solirubrobacteraceae bacterium]